jgi:hypothetical protein
MSSENPEVIPEQDKMVVVVTLRVTLNAREWAETNGLTNPNKPAGTWGHYRRSDVRTDVQKHVLAQTQGSALIEESSGSVSF